MADIINLNKRRKAKKRIDKEKKAVENRIKHGRSKQEKQQAKLAEEKAKKHIDGHKLVGKTQATDEPEEGASSDEES